MITMHAVILAAGQSTRTLPLTATKPKPLLRVANTSILEWNLHQLAGLADSLTIVVGYRAEQIREAVAALAPKRLKIGFVEQKQQNGPGGALRAAASELPERFLVLNGDDLYWHDDLGRLLKHDEALLAKEEKDPAKLRCFGVLEVKDDRLVRIEEKPAKPKSTWVNIGAYVLRKAVLDAKPKRSPRGEDEITDMVTRRAVAANVAVERAAFWQPVSYPWQLLEANEAALRLLKRDVQGTVEKGAVLKGAVAVGKGTVIRSGAYIEGPVAIGSGCVIGPNCYIRPGTSIGDECKVGNGVEVKNSIVGNGTHIGHLSYFGDSILGDGVNAGAGTIAANLRHDSGTVRSAVNKKLVDTGRRKLGCVLADGVHTGIHTSLYPGRKLWPGVCTLPGEVVSKDKLR